MIPQKAFLAALACLLALNGPVNAQGTTVTLTTTTTATQTVTSATETSTVSTQLDNVSTTSTATLVSTLSVTDTQSVTTVGPTTTTTAPQTTQTNINKRCVKYKVNFSKSCCPKKYCKKKPVKKGKGGKRELDEALALGQRDITGPFPSTAPCSTTSFQDFNTAGVGSVNTIVANYNFGSNGASMRIQDLYAPNVCGDIFIDGNQVASTTCPELQPGYVGANINDPDTAIASGKFAFAIINVPAGVHTVTIKETYSGGQAFYKITSNDQCPASVFIDEQTETVFATATETTTSTLAPTSTVTIDETTTTTTEERSTVTTTITPDLVTKTIVPAPIQTTVDQCQTLTVNVKCPNYRSQKMLDSWMLGQLRTIKSKAPKKDVDVACGTIEGEYYY